MDLSCEGEQHPAAKKLHLDEVVDVAEMEEREGRQSGKEDSVEKGCGDRAEEMVGGEGDKEDLEVRSSASERKDDAAANLLRKAKIAVDSKKERDQKRYKGISSLVDNGYSLIEARNRLLLLHAAKHLQNHYTHIAQHLPSIEISGGKTKQTSVAPSGDNLGGATLQSAIDMLLDVAKPTLANYFKISDLRKLRVSSPSFARTKDDILGQLPHADSLHTGIIIFIVYLTQGARSTEIWPDQPFNGVKRGEKIRDEREQMQRLYGDAVKMTSADLLSKMVPVKDEVDVGDLLLISPALLHRGPQSVDERLCFFMAVELSDLTDGYNNDAQHTMDDLAARCFGFNSDEYMTCHDTWLRRGFRIDYDDKVRMHVQNGYKKWKEWVQDGRKGPCMFFTKTGRNEVSGAFSSLFD